MSPYRPDLVECWIFRVPLVGEPEFLLIRRAPGRIFRGLWQCVTGGLEPGERIPMAALREVSEEVGFGPVEIEAFYDLDQVTHFYDCLLYTSDAADDLLCVDLGGRRIIK